MKQTHEQSSESELVRDHILIGRAIQFAEEAHRGQLRKASGIPYIWHPLSVGRTLTDHGLDAEVVAAGLLHDTIEDTDATAEQLREQFGERVTRLVEICSEPRDGRRWEERKGALLQQFATAPIEARLIGAADKLDNLRSISVEIATLGEGIWKKFRRGRDVQAWYFGSMALAIRGLDPETHVQRVEENEHPLFDQVEAIVEDLFGTGTIRK